MGWLKVRYLYSQITENYKKREQKIEAIIGLVGLATLAIYLIILAIVRHQLT